MTLTLEQIIGSLKKYGVDALSKSSIDEISKTLGIDAKSATETLNNAGIQKLKAESENYPLPEQSILDEVEEALKDIREWAETLAIGRPERTGLAQAKNVYDYIAFFSNPNADADTLKKEAGKWRESKGATEGKSETYTNEKIISQIDQWGQDHVKPGTPWTWFKTVDSQSKAYFFRIDDKASSNDPNKYICKKHYDYYLILKENGLIDDLRVFKESMPQKLLQSTAFAKRITDRMMQLTNGGMDEMQCTDVYNHLLFGTAVSNYYEEGEALVTVFCPKCRKPYRAKSYKELESKVCDDCHELLFRTCPNPHCKKHIPAYLDYCTFCNFFIPGEKLFSVYQDQFADAIKRYNLGEARAALNAAVKAKPYASNIEQMRSQLNNLENTIGLYVKELDTLINEGKYHSAQQALPRVRAKVPNIDLADYEKKINDALNWALQEGSSLTRDNESTGVQRCLTILNRVRDDTLAMSWLEAHKPLPVQNVIANIHGSSKTCTLTWKDSSNISVSYTVVRGEGHSPKGLDDGIQVAKNVMSLSFTDHQLKPGIAYYYTVFAIRGASAVGAQCAKPAIMYEELSEDDVIIRVQGDMCRLSWKLPSGCIGVRIIRRDEDCDSSDKPIDVKDQSYSDETVSLGERYIYTLKTIWEIGNTKVYSEGVSVKAVILSRPDPIDLTCKLEDGVAVLTWAVPAQDHDVVIMTLNQGAVLEHNKLYSTDSYRKLGKVCATVRAKGGFYQLPITQGSYLHIAAFSLYNGDAIAGSTVTVSTLKPIEVDREKTDLINGSLHMEFVSLPPEVIKIGVALLMPDQPYSPGNMQAVEKVDGKYNASVENKSYIFEASAYKKEGYISLSNLNFTQQFDVYIFGIYKTPVGEAESEGVRITNLNQKKTVLSCRIKWGSFYNKRKGASFIISSDTGLMPKGALVCSPNGAYPSRWKPDLIRLAEVTPERKAGEPIALSSLQLETVPAKAYLNLLLEPGQDKSFKVEFDRDNFIIPKK